MDDHDVRRDAFALLDACRRRARGDDAEMVAALPDDNPEAEHWLRVAIELASMFADIDDPPRAEQT